MSFSQHFSMYKLLLLLLGICLAILNTEGALAAAAASPATTIEASADAAAGISPPRYKYYRHKAKSRKAKRRARRERKSGGLLKKRPKGVITVEPPTRNN
jgi:hypothetical protein